MQERLLQVWESFTSRLGFPGHDRVYGPVSRHGSQAVGGGLVAT